MKTQNLDPRLVKDMHPLLVQASKSSSYSYQDLRNALLKYLYRTPDPSLEKAEEVLKNPAMLMESYGQTKENGDLQAQESYRNTVSKMAQKRSLDVQRVLEVCDKFPVRLSYEQLPRLLDIIKQHPEEPLYVVEQSPNLPPEVLDKEDRKVGKWMLLLQDELEAGFHTYFTEDSIPEIQKLHKELSAAFEKFDNILDDTDVADAFKETYIQQYPNYKRFLELTAQKGHPLLKKVVEYLPSPEKFKEHVQALNLSSLDCQDINYNMKNSLAKVGVMLELNRSLGNIWAYHQTDLATSVFETCFEKTEFLKPQIKTALCNGVNDLFVETSINYFGFKSNNPSQRAKKDYTTDYLAWFSKHPQELHAMITSMQSLLARQVTNEEIRQLAVLHKQNDHQPLRFEKKDYNSLVNSLDNLDSRIFLSLTDTPGCGCVVLLKDEELTVKDGCYAIKPSCDIKEDLLPSLS